jgi:multiple sugar transport system substrate-binding protein
MSMKQPMKQAPKRGLAAVGVAATALALTLVGCSSSGSASANGTTTITFWNSFTASDRPAVEALVAKFNKSQSKYKIKMTISPADVLAQKLLPAYASGTGPTITTLDASQVPEYVGKGVFAAVDDLYSSDGLDASKLPKASLDATKLNGKQYGVPFAATGTMLYFNKKLFAAAGIKTPPTTMDELANDAKLTTKDTGKQSTSQYGFIVSDHAGPATWPLLIWAQGGDIVSTDGKTSELDSPATAQALQYWVDLIRNDHVSPTGLAGTDTDNLFSAGRAAMYINGPWASAGFRQAGVDFGVAPVPKGVGGQFSTAISVNMHLNAHANGAQKSAAYAFFKFWNTEDSQVYWATHSAYPPNVSGVAASKLSSNPVAVEFSGAVNPRFYLPGLKHASEIDNNVVIPTIQKVTSGAASPGSVLHDASKQIQQLLDGGQ